MNGYYDGATELYEWIWDDCIHIFRFHKDESFKWSVRLGKLPRPRLTPSLPFYPVSGIYPSSVFLFGVDFSRRTPPRLPKETQAQYPRSRRR